MENKIGVFKLKSNKNESNEKLKSTNNINLDLPCFLLIIEKLRVKTKKEIG